MKRLISILLAFVLLLSLTFNAFAEVGQTLPDRIDNTTVWSYLDDNSDPAGNPSDAGYNRTAWTAADFDDSTWKTGVGGFGAKTGGPYSGAAVTLDGCPGNETNYPTYYFRTKVNVNKASAVTAIKGSISYDDAAIIYINGIKAAAFNEAGCDSNNSYSANKANSTDNFEIINETVLNALKNGEMKRFHGLSRARGWGLRSVLFQAKLTAIAVNLKRIAAITGKETLPVIAFLKKIENHFQNFILNTDFTAVFLWTDC